jgi:ubiquinone/menaquinone biosynthesis C-methylase UbiE
MRRVTTLGEVALSDFWERQAESWVRWAREPGHDTYWRFHRDRFLDLVPPPGRLTVDVGCGEGRLARDLKAIGHTVLAVDRSPTMVLHARAADPALDVREADAAALPLGDREADLVVSFMSLMNTDDLDAAVREAARVLAAGGRYCIALTHSLNTAGAFESEEPDARFVIEGSYFDRSAKEVAVERAGLEMTFLDAHRPLEDYFRALEEAGFLVERVREIPDSTKDPERPSMLRWHRIPLFLHIRAVPA